MLEAQVSVEDLSDEDDALSFVVEEDYEQEAIQSSHESPSQRSVVTDEAGTQTGAGDEISGEAGEQGVAERRLVPEQQSEADVIEDREARAKSPRRVSYYPWA